MDFPENIGKILDKIMNISKDKFYYKFLYTLFKYKYVYIVYIYIHIIL